MQSERDPVLRAQCYEIYSGWGSNVTRGREG